MGHYQPLPVTTFATLLERYSAAITAAARDPADLVTALLTRDAVARALHGGALPSRANQRALLAADAQLRRLLVIADPALLEPWCANLKPSIEAWWWHVSGAEIAATTAQDEQYRRLGAQFLTLIALGLLAEFLRRLWVGVPDQLSVLGLTLAAAIASSGLVTPFRAELERSLGRLSRLPGGPPAAPLWLAGALSMLALLLVVGGLPLLASWANQRGLDALEAGDLDSARRAFQRAAALAPEAAVPLQNLGRRYAELGLLDEAVTTFHTAIEREARFPAPYADLGHVLNLQGEHAAAEVLLTRALVRSDVAAPDPQGVALVARYTMLADLGWAYFAQQKLALAVEALEAARALDPELANLPVTVGDQRNAIPAYYLAQVYEAQGRSVEATALWREAVRRLRDDSWPNRERYHYAIARLEALEAGTP
jgi:tetratricopeptide (TPR) repeat protein